MSNRFTKAFSGMCAKAVGGVTDAMTGAVVGGGRGLVKGLGMSVGLAAVAAGGVVQGSKKVIGLGGGVTKVKGIFTGGLRKRFGLNREGVSAKIGALEDRIRDLYLQIGTKTSKLEEEEGEADDGELRAITEQITEHEKEIRLLKKYLVELEQVEAPGSAKKLTLARRLEGEERFQKSLGSSVEHCLRRAKFALRSDAILFEKALHDLLDEEIEIKRLAASELGKIGNTAAAPALKEALRIESPQLQAEILNSLILIEDRDLFAICKRFRKHDYFGVRTACMRGFYKAGRQEAEPYLIEALRDENVEVRNSAAVFLGWLEAGTATVPLLQAARDEDKRVRKSAILALTNIRDETAVLPLIRLLNDEDKEIREKVRYAIERISGEPVEFPNDAAETERSQAVERLKDWWLKKQHEAVGSDAEAEVEAKTKKSRRKVEQAS